MTFVSYGSVGQFLCVKNSIYIGVCAYFHEESYFIFKFGYEKYEGGANVVFVAH